MPLDFNERDVVVTGGTGELGAVVARMFLAAGAIVHVPCRDAGRPGKLAGLSDDRLRLTGGIDLGDEAAVVRFYESVPALWASIHAAGGFTMSPIASTSLDDYRKLMTMNATSCFLCCREAIRAIRRSGRTGAEGMGRIVNVAAIPALEPRRGSGMIAYTASKSAVASITVALAEEVAAEGIWVNAIVPSIMDTEANRKAMPKADPSKWAKLDEVASTIAFLASPQNRVTRGALVPVNGRA